MASLAEGIFIAEKEERFEKNCTKEGMWILAVRVILTMWLQKLFAINGLSDIALEKALEKQDCQ